MLVQERMRDKEGKIFMQNVFWVYQSETSYGVTGVGNQYWVWSRCILVSSKCYHMPTKRNLGNHGKLFDVWTIMSFKS